MSNLNRNSQVLAASLLATLSGASLAGNVLVNGNFDHSTQGWAGSGARHFVFSDQDAEARPESGSGKIDNRLLETVTGFVRGPAQRFSVAPGTRSFNVSAMVKPTKPGAVVGNANAHLNFTEYSEDCENAGIQNVTRVLQLGAGSKPIGEWTTIEETVIPLGRTRCAQLSLEYPEMRGVALFDNVEVRRQESLAGVWLPVGRDGEGISIHEQAAGGEVFITWYTYRHGQQLWLVGQGERDANNEPLRFDLYETGGAGFGSRFDPGDVTTTWWGQIEIDSGGCGESVLRYREAGGERGDLPMVRLLDSGAVPCEHSPGAPVSKLDREGIP